MVYAAILTRSEGEVQANCKRKERATGRERLASDRKILRSWSGCDAVEQSLQHGRVERLGQMNVRTDFEGPTATLFDVDSKRDQPRAIRHCGPLEVRHARVEEHDIRR